MWCHIFRNDLNISNTEGHLPLTSHTSSIMGSLSSVRQIPYLKSWAIFWLNHVLLFLILDVDTQVNKQYFSICNENAPQHTDIVWKGLVLQTRTWKWTAVILFATSCISNSSSKSNNRSNNVITAINNSSDINNSELQRMGQTFVKSKWRYRQTGLSNAARQTIRGKNTSSQQTANVLPSSKKRKPKMSPVCVHFNTSKRWSSSSVTFSTLRT